MMSRARFLLVGLVLVAAAAGSTFVAVGSISDNATVTDDNREALAGVEVRVDRAIKALLRKGILRRGADGLTGGPGPRGRRGRDGADGEDGGRGPRGAGGQDGADGGRGPRGEDGARGVAGAVGARGADGGRGPAGEDGSDGRDGTDGRDGLDGQDGADGPPGRDGATPTLAGQQVLCQPPAAPGGTMSCVILPSPAP